MNWSKMSRLERNALVEEKVFGKVRGTDFWFGIPHETPVGDCECHQYCPKCDARFDGRFGGRWEGPTRTNECHKDPPDYTILIADAWHVVEKMRADGFSFSLHDDVDDGSGVFPSEVVVEATFEKNVGPRHFEGFHSGKKGGDAEAICLAALKALGVDVE